LKSAKTADELRRAQAVALPDMFGVDLEGTGAMIGKSRTSVARLRSEFLTKRNELTRKNREGRRRVPGVTFKWSPHIHKVYACRFVGHDFLEKLFIDSSFLFSGLDRVYFICCRLLIKSDMPIDTVC
jgi:hypothetical protein